MAVYGYLALFEAESSSQSSKFHPVHTVDHTQGVLVTSLDASQNAEKYSTLVISTNMKQLSYRSPFNYTGPTDVISTGWLKGSQARKLWTRYTES